MANNGTLIPIPGRLRSVATEGHVAGADEIIDDTLQKDQATLNSESSFLSLPGKKLEEPDNSSCFNYITQYKTFENNKGIG